MRRTTVLLGLLLSAALLMSGCTAGAIPEFAEDQTSDDVIADLDESSSTLQASTTRRVGEVDGYDIFLARDSVNGVCIVLVLDGTLRSAGCGGTGVGTALPTGTKIEAGDYDSGAAEREQLSESVFVVRAG